MSVEPFSWRRPICAKTKTNKKKGNKKCREKKNFSKLFLKEKSPHNQNIILSPIGIIVNKLVITVAPHKDIWPQTST